MKPLVLPVMVKIVSAVVLKEYSCISDILHIRDMPKVLIKSNLRETRTWLNAGTDGHAETLDKWTCMTPGTEGHA